jgi:uroporphyrinogen decarboxylase
MNSLERVRLAATGRPADRVPVGPYLANWTARWAGFPLSAYCTDGRVMAEAQLLALERLGQDIVFPDSDNYYLAEGFGCRAHIPVDDIPSLAQPAVEGLEQVFDLEVPDPYRDGRMPVILEAIERIHDQVGDEVPIRVPGTGPFAVASYLVGVERFLLELALVRDDRDDVRRQALERMLELTTQALMRFGLAEIKAGAHLVQCGDSLASASVISPEMFQRWVLPYHQRVFRAWKEAGAITVLHVCGNNSRILHLLAETGADIVAVDHLVDLRLAKATIGGQVCLIGNLAPVETMLQGTQAMVAVQARECLAAAAGGGGYILGTGCEVPLDTPVENLEALVQVGKAHRYEVVDQADGGA